MEEFDWLATEDGVWFSSSCPRSAVDSELPKADDAEEKRRRYTGDV
jgi:hypothetical protein